MPGASVPTKQSADQQAVRQGGNTFLVWIPEKPSSLSTFPVAGIMNTAGTDIKSGGVFCTQIDMPDIVKTPINEVEVMLSGGKVPISYTDGFKIEPFEITLLGNALSAFYAALGQSPTTQPVIDHNTVKFGKRGHMIIYAFGNPATGGKARLMRTTLLLNMSVMIDKLAGYTADGVTNQPLTFYNDRGDGNMLELQGYQTFVWELWADNATILNGSIPGATLDVGTGNNSYASPTTPTTFIFDAVNRTGIDQRFAYISVNGVQQNTANGTTFAAPTITLPAATVVPATVLAIYAMDTSALTANSQIPNWGTGRPMDVGWHSWLGPA